MSVEKKSANLSPFCIRSVFLSLLAIMVSFTDARGEVKSRAVVFSLEGGATVLREGKTIPATEAMALLPGDELAVADPGLVALQLSDGSYVRVPSGSKMRFPGEERSIGLLAGVMHFFSHSEQHPTVVTEHVTAAIRGTEFTAAIGDQETTIWVFSGAVEGASPGGTASLHSGQGARFKRGAAPQLFAVLSSERAVQWSLFTPILGVDHDLALFERGGELERQAVAKMRAGDPVGALMVLPKDGGEICSSVVILRARLHVLLGNAEKGSQALAACVSRSIIRGDSHAPQFALAAATLSLVSLMRGDTARANDLSQRAVAVDGELASVKIARSFLLQETGDLEGALAAVGEVDVHSDPDLRARRAEVLFMFGKVPQARAILEGLPARSWYADTVLGFVLLADRSFDDARSAFERAAEAESGAGLPQLGLGLLAVHGGDLVAGRRHFERATALEPSRALYRSYLAKSYFESDTYAPAAPEYERAMELDPNDPTPYLYRSFMRLAENRPIEALRDIEGARDRSEKRSVYRSRMLLDQDAAVQSASLARTYRDLGFVERGKIEAIAAMTADYQNASAHRLLSEIQDNVFSADASLSERRIADLFAPLSINVVDSIGSSVSLNEYSSLFERDGRRTGVSSSFASFQDIGKTGVFSAHKEGNVVTGLSATGVISNGLDTSPRSSEGRAAASLQAQPSWANRFFVEGRGVFGEDSDKVDTSHFDTGSFSAGALHRFSPDVSAIFQSSFERGREKFQQRSIDDDVALSLQADGVREDYIVATLADASINRYSSLWVNEGQLIARTGNVSSLFTVRSATTSNDSYDNRLILEDETGILDGQEIPLTSSAPAHLQSEVVSYLGTITLTKEMFLNVGGSYEQVEWSGFEEPPFDANSSSRSRVNPKVGLLYRPSATIMYRIGYGESLGKGMQADLASVEPTLIGGITQRFNDAPGTFARNFGAGVDLQPWKNGYLGTGCIRRWLDEGQSGGIYSLNIDFDDNLVERGIQRFPLSYSSIDQDFVNSYWYQVVDNQWVLGVDYRYAMETRGDEGDIELRDQRAKGFSRYFLTNGVFLQGSSTYLHQGRRNRLDVLGDSASGWIFGAGVGYRLPTRHGLLLAEFDNIFGQDFNLSQALYFQDVISNDPMVKLSASFNF